MQADVTMPNLGYDMEEGKIVSWLKKVGDRVERGEPIAEIETDKTTVEMEAIASGTLVEIVAGRGQHGRGRRGHRAAGERRLNGRPPVPQTPDAQGGRRRMTDSKQQAPHFYVQTEIDDGRAARACSTPRTRAPAVRVTATAALVRACVAALRQQPRFNSVWTDEGLLEADEINVGIAIALDDGLIAPALLGGGPPRPRGRPPRRWATSSSGRARGELRPAELTDATFTLSNLGMFDVTAFTAIVTPPQVAILATGRRGRARGAGGRRAEGRVGADGDAERRPPRGRRRRRGALSGDVQAARSRTPASLLAEPRASIEEAMIVTIQETVSARHGIRPARGLVPADAGDPPVRGEGAGALHAGPDPGHDAPLPGAGGRLRRRDRRAERARLPDDHLPRPRPRARARDDDGGVRSAS